MLPHGGDAIPDEIFIPRHRDPGAILRCLGGLDRAPDRGGRLGGLVAPERSAVHDKRGFSSGVMSILVGGCLRACLMKDDDAGGNSPHVRQE